MLQNKEKNAIQFSKTAENLLYTSCSINIQVTRNAMRFLQILMITICLTTPLVSSFQPSRLSELDLDDPFLFQKLLYKSPSIKDSNEGGYKFSGNEMRYGR
uniref:Uncharacterized protein n=1 Tax=Trichobilharzia regenti TaxID=157069 RepID=A0AA85JV65_TRIRE|nr:unnamed protein product [Trichobilharzia regenti]